MNKLATVILTDLLPEGMSLEIKGKILIGTRKEQTKKESA